jgi:plasmid stabilization system protein ParE
MNASRLREIVDLLLEREGTFQIQALLDQLRQRLSDLVSQPQQPSIQSEFSQALERLTTANNSLRVSFQPAQTVLVQEIGAAKYFAHDFAADIRSWITENPLSPVVAQQKLNTFVDERQHYIQQLTQLRDNFEAIRVRASSLQAGDAEIGFLLPRSLFNNRLDQLIKELRDINRIIRAFSEATVGRVEEVEVREISTSDPFFFFHIDPATIAALAAAVTWALNTWKQVEEIRRVRAETRKTEVLTEKEASDVFDKKIMKKSSLQLRQR